MRSIYIIIITVKMAGGVKGSLCLWKLGRAMRDNGEHWQGVGGRRGDQPRQAGL